MIRLVRKYFRIEFFSSERRPEPSKPLIVHLRTVSVNCPGADNEISNASTLLRIVDIGLFVGLLLRPSPSPNIFARYSEMAI